MRRVRRSGSTPRPRIGLRREWITSQLGVVSLLLAFGSPLPAASLEEQGLRPRFSHIRTDDGLSSAWVHAILQDSYGFLWLGTQDGLNRYDGARIKVYRHDPRDPASIPTPAVGALYEDSQRRLWVGTGWGNQGVALYDRRQERFRSILPNPGDSRGNNVSCIVEDRQGRLWIGTNNGVARLDPEAWSITRFPVVPDDRIGVLAGVVYRLFEDRAGVLWVGTAAGPRVFDRQTGRYSMLPAVERAPGRLATAFVHDFYEDDSGGLWIATLGDGLHHLDPARGHSTAYLPDAADPTSIGHARVRRLVPDGKGRLYIGTENGGLNVLDLATRRFSRHLPMPEDESSLSSGSIYALHLDRQGGLWVGTFDGGVDYLPPNQEFKRLTVRHGGISDSHVSALMEDRRGNLWIGTNGGGVNRLDPRTGRVTQYRHDPSAPDTIGSDAVWALLEDRRGRIWVGGWDSGISRLDPKSGRARRYRHNPSDPRTVSSDHIWRIVELHSGELLLATHRGAELFDPETGRASRLAERFPGADDGAVYTVAEAPNGDLWLGGIAPAGRIDRRTGAITRLRLAPESGRRSGVGWTQAVLVDSRGNVWLGTDGGLVCLPGGRGEPRRFGIEHGLPADNVTSLAEDDSGHLWLGTTRGLSKLVDGARLPAEAVFLNFDVHDGLQGNEFARNAALRGRDGQLFFGGSSGLTWFDPERLRQNASPPPVVLTDLKIFNEPVPIGVPGSPLREAITTTASLELSHRHTMVTFEFAALDFVAPGKNQYAYLLEGFDRGWNQVGNQRTATYTNLPGGTFTLRVRGSNNDGVWNDEGARLTVRVRPPFWKTGWFLATSALLAVAAAVTAHRLRIGRRVRQVEARLAHEARLEREYRGRLEALVQEKTRELEAAQAEVVRTARLSLLGQVTATVSHELRNPLGTVRNSIFSIREGVERGQADRIARALALAERNVQRCDAIITDLLDFTRRRELRLEDTPLDAWLEAMLDEFLVPEGVRLARDLVSGATVRIDSERLRRAVFNVLTNAAQALQGAGTPEATIRVTSRRRDGQAEIEVADNGPGIPEELRSRVFEPLFSTKSFGVGLGLPIVRAILHEHGGDLRIEQTAGPGTTITLWIPAGGA